jgi:hypothetical protein
MKTIKTLLLTILTAAFVAAPLARAEDKAKPYPLEKCVVSDEKLGEMGKPYVFTHEGQEVKLCCKSCLKDFNKDSKKYMKKIADAEKDKAKK